jgi:hypothetical protein
MIDDGTIESEADTKCNTPPGKPLVYCELVVPLKPGDLYVEGYGIDLVYPGSSNI